MVGPLRELQWAEARSFEAGMLTWHWSGDNQKEVGYIRLALKAEVQTTQVNLEVGYQCCLSPDTIALQC